MHLSVFFLQQILLLARCPSLRLPVTTLNRPTSNPVSLDPADLHPSLQGGFYCFKNQQYV